MDSLKTRYGQAKAIVRQKLQFVIEKSRIEDVEPLANCCCGLFSLRQGTFLLGFYLLLSGIGEVISEKWIGFGLIVVASQGIYAAYSRSENETYRYLQSLGALFVVKVFLFLFMDANSLYTRELIIEKCKMADNEDACRQYLATMKHATHASYFVALGILVFIYAWTAFVGYSYHQVLACGGTGDERLSARALTYNEKKPLVSV